MKKENIGLFAQEVLDRKAKDPKKTNAAIAKELGMTEEYVKAVIDKNKEVKK